MACITDPIDLHLLQHLRETTQGDDDGNSDNHGCMDITFQSPPPATEPPPNEETKYCWVCETSVAQHSMHCKYCNKCVSHFDHHCLWLNTCVGHANYGYFCKILWSTCCMLVVHTSCMLGIVIDVFLDGPTQNRANEWFGANAWGVVVGINLFFLVTNMISLSAMAQLLHFHISLQKKNLTTYQFIVSDNARRREAFQKKEERKAKRAAAVSKARREGNQILATRIELGQYCCTACDVLPIDEEVPAAAEANGGHETTAYAELSDGDEPEDEKKSVDSDRDLVLMNATSLGDSSSFQLGSKEGIRPSTSSDNVTAENSNEEEATVGGDGDQVHVDDITSPANGFQEGSNSNNAQKEVEAGNVIEAANENVAVESNGEDKGATNEGLKPTVGSENEQSSTDSI